MMNNCLDETSGLTLHEYKGFFTNYDIHYSEFIMRLFISVLHKPLAFITEFSIPLAAVAELQCLLVASPAFKQRKSGRII